MISDRMLYTCCAERLPHHQKEKEKTLRKRFRVVQVSRLSKSRRPQRDLLSSSPQTTPTEASCRGRTSKHSASRREAALGQTHCIVRANKEERAFNQRHRTAPRRVTSPPTQHLTTIGKKWEPQSIPADLRSKSQNEALVSSSRHTETGVSNLKKGSPGLLTATHCTGALGPENLHPAQR